MSRSPPVENAGADCGWPQESLHFKQFGWNYKRRRRRSRGAEVRGFRQFSPLGAAVRGATMIAVIDPPPRQRNQPGRLPLVASRPTRKDLSLMARCATLAWCALLCSVTFSRAVPLGTNAADARVDFG